MALDKPSKFDRDVRRYERTQAKAADVRKKARAQARMWHRLRAAVYDRDHGQCRVCGHLVRFQSRSPFDIAHTHHIVYRSAGGTDALANLVLLCGICHEDEHRHRISITGTADTLTVTRRRA
jgi:5-methylcytosine-specific restriction endonuclease McrA